MLSIKRNNINEIIINKSRFIACLYFINDENDISKYLDKVKKDFKDASHYCFAYIYNNHEKASDDNEPKKTAGNVILNVLKQNNLSNVLCVVVRYFGGIKLGSGGLCRAYSTATCEVLSKNEIVNFMDGYIIEITFSYNNLKKIDHLVLKYVFNRIFDDEISYLLKISLNDYLLIYDSLLKLVNNIIIKEKTSVEIN